MLLNLFGMIGAGLLPKTGEKGVNDGSYSN